MGDIKARAKDDLGNVQEALAVTEEAKHKAEAEAEDEAEAETILLKFERTSLLMKFGVEKDEVSSLQSQASKDNEAMEKDY